MKNFSIILSAVLAVMVAGTSHAAFISFDDAPDGTVINSRYAGLGVTFSNVSPGGGTSSNVFARATAFALSPPNEVSVFSTGLEIFNENFGVIQAAFSTPALSVSIAARSIEAPEGFGFIDRAYLDAFSPSGTLIQRVTTSGTETPFETLTIDASSSLPIASVKFSATVTPGRPSVFGEFDNLNFTPVPEPASLVLFGLGSVGLLGYAWSRRRTATA